MPMEIELSQMRGQDSRSSRFSSEKLPPGFMCSGARLTKPLPHSVLCVLRFGLACRKQPKSKKSKHVKSSQPELDNARQLKDILHRSVRREHKETIKHKRKILGTLWGAAAFQGNSGNCSERHSYKETFRIYSCDTARGSHRRETV